MHSAWRSLVWILGLVVGLLILSLFIGFLIKLFVAAALLALAYYWYQRALDMRRRRHWW